MTSREIPCACAPARTAGVPAIRDASGAPARPPRGRAGWLPTWREGLAAATVAGALLLGNDLFVCESVVVRSGSMQPTILPNERVFLTRFPVGPVRRFELVVVASPRFGERLAKRVIGLPGERVRLEDSWRVFINDRSLEYSAATATHERVEGRDHPIRLGPAPTASVPTVYGATTMRLGPDEYFVLGDNRLASEDSRAFGPVRRNEIQGSLGTVWYSYDRAHHRLRLARVLHALR
jgi:signal peptidase I